MGNKPRVVLINFDTGVEIDRFDNIQKFSEWQASNREAVVITKSGNEIPMRIAVRLPETAPPSTPT